MKYWWLEKYKNFKIIQINGLTIDVNYFLTMPKNYEKKYQEIKDIDIDILNEEELLILLKVITNTKNIKNNKLRLIIEKLLLIPDNSFPRSDYSLQEELIEIKNLKNNLPYKEKLDNNNIAICYNCLNIFFVDKIKNINKKDLCICPYCLKTKLYFDNDYIPMDYTFIKLTKLYYGVSSLGCSFKNIQKIIKKNIITEIGIKKKNYLSISKLVPSKLGLIDEKILFRKLYLTLYEKEDNLIEEETIYISLKNQEDIILSILLITIMEVLANTIYLKRIKLVFDKEENKKIFDNMLKIIITHRF